MLEDFYAISAKFKTCQKPFQKKFEPTKFPCCTIYHSHTSLIPTPILATKWQPEEGSRQDYSHTLCGLAGFRLLLEFGLLLYHTFCRKWETS